MIPIYRDHGLIEESNKIMKNASVTFSDLPLRRKVIIAFILISLLPLLVVVFLFISKQDSLNVKVILGLVLGVLISLGWLIIAGILRSISTILDKTHEHAGIVGEISETENEIKILDGVFDNMSTKIKKSFEELKDISKNTESLNQEITKKVALLSTIIQVNDLVSQELETKEVFRFAVRRIRDILNFDICFILLDTGQEDFVKEAIDSSQEIKFESISKNEPFLQPLIEAGQTLMLDLKHYFRQDFRDFANDVLKAGSIVLVPIILKKEVVGILGGARQDAGYSFSKDQIETLKIFARHISLLLERRVMSLKIKDLEIRDALTGLYNSRFIKGRLEEEIKRAIDRQRPCGFILIKIKDIKGHIEKFGILSLEAAFKSIAGAVREDLDISEKAGRISEDKLAIVAPEKSKTQLEKRAGDLVYKLKNNLSKQGIELDLVFSVA